MTLSPIDRSLAPLVPPDWAGLLSVPSAIIDSLALKAVLDAAVRPLRDRGEMRAAAVAVLREGFLTGRATIAADFLRPKI